ncbi:MAG: molecular chaperone TorD family protein [Desulfonatronovibrio sp.]
MNDMTDNPLIARGTAYRLLAYAFGYPKQEFADIMNQGAWQELGQTLVQQSRESREELRLCFSDDAAAQIADFWAQPVEKVQAAYTSTFDMGKPQPPCPPYTGLYLSGAETYPGPRTDLISDLQCTYLSWGLEPGPELSDHLSVELEFMHFLCVTANAALEAGDETTLARARTDYDWLRNHLAVCAPLIAREARENASHPFWSIAGDLLCILAADTSSPAVFVNGYAR